MPQGPAFRVCLRFAVRRSAGSPASRTGPPASRSTAWCRRAPSLRPSPRAHAAARLPRARAARPSASPCCRARPWRWRRVRPCRILRPGAALARLVETRVGAIAIFFRHFRSPFFAAWPWPCFDRWFRRVFAVGGFLRQSQRAQLLGPLSDRDVGGRDIGHRLDAFDILGALAVQPDLLQFGAALFGSSSMSCL